MQGIIDRFEGEYAVIHVCDKRINFPRDLLPPDTVEGSCLNISIEVDHKTTQARRETIEGLLNKLKNKHGK